MTPLPAVPFHILAAATGNVRLPTYEGVLVVQQVMKSIPRAIFHVINKTITFTHCLSCELKLDYLRLCYTQGCTDEVRQCMSNTTNGMAILLRAFYRAMLAQSAVMRLHVVRPSVRPSVTFRYRV